MHNNTFYKEILDLIPAIVYVNQIDDLNDFTSSKNVYLNPIGLNNIAFTREEIDQMGHEFFFKLMHPDDFKVGPDSINYLTMKEGEVYGGFQRILYTDGNYHWSYGYSSIFKMKDGKPWQFISCNIDIENQMHTHEQFLELIKENHILKNKLLCHSLTKRELQICKLIAHGKTDNAISTDLFISIKTAKTHRNNILKKLNLHNSAELVRFAVENNLC